MIVEIQEFFTKNIRKLQLRNEAYLPFSPQVIADRNNYIVLIKNAKGLCDED